MKALEDPRKIAWSAALRNGTGRGVRVGLLDTGVDSRHPDLAGRIAAHYEARVDVEHGQVVRCEEGRDFNEHGTACAGIIVRHAPDAEVHSVQIIGDHPRDSPLKLIAGFRFAVEQGWDVINISAGSGTPHPELRELADAAWQAGLIVIAAKDNRPEVTGYPAAFSNVLAIDMEHFTEPFAFTYDPAAEVQIEASGIYIDAPLSGGGRKFFTGSSFAAPHIAALAARLKSAVPKLDCAQLRDALPPLARCPCMSKQPE